MRKGEWTQEDLEAVWAGLAVAPPGPIQTIRMSREARRKAKLAWGTTAG
jgi:hypothetical protein